MFGICLDDVEKKMIEENELENFSQIEIVESLKNKVGINKKHTIETLYGNNGPISENELKKAKEIFVK